MAKVVGYVRVSTADQAEHGVSLDAQVGRIHAYCTMHGHDMAVLHRDDGVSAATLKNRPGFHAAMDAVCSQKGSILVVYSLSRMSRSVRDTIDIAERLRLAGAELASLTENLDTTTATGRMVFKLLAVFAEFERDVLSERTSAALRHKAKNGERVGRYAQYGMELLADGTLAPNAEEQATINVIVTLSATSSPERIAELLNKAGTPCRSKRWTAASVKRILSRKRG